MGFFRLLAVSYMKYVGGLDEMMQRLDKRHEAASYEYEDTRGKLFLLKIDED